MCINTRLVRNPYTSQMVRVACGKCPACLQAKAQARTIRIRNNVSSDMVSYFVTLTYDNKFLPYILRSEMVGTDGEINVYRDASSRMFKGRQIVHDGTHVIGTMPYSDDNILEEFPLIPDARRKAGCVSVIFYKDVQDFIKRLKQHLIRNYEIKRLQFFNVAEYGPVTKRSHFHLLLYLPKEVSFDTVQSAVSTCWTYGDRDRTSRYVEIALDASAYVSSYVSRPTSSTDFYTKTAFRQKHSSSKGFGVGLDCFSLLSVLDCLRRRDLSYTKQTFVDGVPLLSSVLVPQYVINRYFPKVKGYSSVNDDAIRKLLLVPQLLADEVGRCNPRCSWSDDDLHRYSVRIKNVARLWCSQLNWSYDEFWASYPFLFTDVWNLYKSQVLRRSYELVEKVDDYATFYENLNELDFGNVRSDLSDILSSDSLCLDANKRPDVVLKTQELSLMYDKYDKNKKVINRVMSEIGHNV